MIFTLKSISTNYSKSCNFDGNVSFVKTLQLQSERKSPDKKSLNLFPSQLKLTFDLKTEIDELGEKQK